MKLKLITFSSQLSVSYLFNLVSINVSDSGSKNYSIIQCECDKWLVDLQWVSKARLLHKGNDFQGTW